MSVLGKPVVRAAVYTRKSSDEGLDQVFNSLDAQHEACNAYIASQRHEGWKLIKRRFDDGGISDGTLERPALQALLSDVDQGLVDMIVVYEYIRDHPDCLQKHIAEDAGIKKQNVSRNIKILVARGYVVGNNNVGFRITRMLDDQ